MTSRSHYCSFLTEQYIHKKRVRWSRIQEAAREEGKMRLRVGKRRGCGEREGGDGKEGIRGRVREAGGKS